MKNKISIGTYNDVHLCSEIPTSAETFSENIKMLNNSNLDYVINLGDNIMDGSIATAKKVAADWKQFQDIQDKLIPETMNIPGNHDYFSWVAKRPVRSIETEQAFTNLLMVDIQARHFDNWIIIGMNSSQKSELNPERGYDAKFTDKQIKELTFMLNKNVESTNPKFVCIATHIPILTITPLMDRRQAANQRQYEFPNNHMHSDSYDIVKLLSEYKEVKLCISGHQHMVDEVTYNGIKFVCCGSLCGMWWNKPVYKGHHAGNMFFDLYEDGTVENTYVKFQHLHPADRTTSVSFGHNFLYSHPVLEKQFKINDKHAIVNRRDLQEINDFMKENVDVLNKFGEFKKLRNE